MHFVWDSKIGLRVEKRVPNSPKMLFTRKLDRPPGSPWEKRRKRGRSGWKFGTALVHELPKELKVDALLMGVTI